MKMKSIIFRKNIRVQDGRTLSLEYSLMTSSDDGARADYGAAISCTDGQKTEYQEICNLTAIRARARALVERLARGAVTPVTMRDVVMDWL